MRGSATLNGLLLALLAITPGAADAEDRSAGESVVQPVAGQPLLLVRRDLSDPLPVMAARQRALGPPSFADRALAFSVLRPPDLRSRHRPPVPATDALVAAQRAVPAPRGVAPTPAPLVSFEGLDADDSFAEALRVAPPDTVGAAGPGFYVQMINLVFALFDKDGSVCGTAGCIPVDGGPFANNVLWDGFGGICESANHGDPIVLYDHLADRWVFSQFAGSFADTHQCFAVSQTGDPRGLYHRYDFDLSPGLVRFDDYPKIGLWPDAYVMTANEFSTSGSVYYGAVVFAFERAEMLAGNAADSARLGPLSCPPDPEEGPCFFSLQPGHLEGPPPPAGTPDPIVMAFDDLVWGESDAPGPDGYRLWELDVDWAAMPQAMLSVLPQVDAADFDSNLCGFPRSGGCVPQPAPGDLLDDLGQFTMFRAQVRDWGGEQSLLVSHTVDVDGDGQAGVRWAEIRGGNGAWTLAQSGTHAPDAEHRWMGSAAMNGAGDVAVGYSLSSTTTHPSVVYATREELDTPGTLPGGEVVLQAGTGAQIGTNSRWGDYSAMVVDPQDDCTFWYTQEYYESDASFDFKTRIGAFRMPGPLRAAPAALEFGGVLLPGFETALATIGNRCSGGPIDIVAMTLTDPSSFSLDTTTGTCGSTTPTIASGSQCTIGVTFVPAAAGLFAQTLTIDSTGTGTTQRTVDLLGGGCAEEHRDLEEEELVTGTVGEIACRTITAGPYAIAGEVEFLAGEALVLEDGFGVEAGGSFTGVIDARLAP